MRILGIETSCDETSVAVVEVGVQECEVGPPGRILSKAKLEARSRLVAGVGVVAAQETVAAESVAGRMLQHRAPCPRERAAVGQRPPGRDAGGPQPVVADRYFAVERPLGDGVARLQLDEPAERVRAVTRSLRAAQDLDLLEVEQRGDHADAAEVDLVHKETDRRIRRALVLLEFADAAQLVVARPRARARPGQRRQERQQFLQVYDAGIANGFASQYRDPAGSCVRAPHTQGRCDDHGLERCRRRRDACRRSHGWQQEEKRQKLEHRLLPTPVLTGSGSTGSPVRPASQVLSRPPQGRADSSGAATPSQ